MPAATRVLVAPIHDVLGWPAAPLVPAKAIW
jgi:hypothetical protein